MTNGNSVPKKEAQTGIWKIVDTHFDALLAGFISVLVIILIYHSRGDAWLALTNLDIRYTVPAAIASIVALLIIIWMSSKGSGGNCHPNWYNTPLGLPAGSVRAIIALIFVFTILLGARETGDLPGWLMGILGTILGFYFGERKTDGESNGAEEKLSRIMGIVAACTDEDNKIAAEEKLSRIKEIVGD